MSAIFVMIPFATIELLYVGGFCAEGGPYVIRQECPDGVIPVLAGGIPLLIVFGIAYALALPEGWRSLLGWAWPILFLELAGCFIAASFTASDQGFTIAPFITGLVMAGIGLLPAIGLPVVPTSPRASGASESSGRASLAYQFGFVLAGGICGYLLWSAIV